MRVCGRIRGPESSRPPRLRQSDPRGANQDCVGGLRRRADHPQAALASRQMSSGGAMLAFEVAGGKAAAFRMANALSIVGISNNLGDAKSLITHPETTTHQRLKPEQRAALGIGPGLLRLSVGLEDADDLIEDLAQALDKAAPNRAAAE